MVKVNDGKYINVDRMTYAEADRKMRLTVHFAVGGGDYVGASCSLRLEQPEAEVFQRWLDSRSENAGR